MLGWRGVLGLIVPANNSVILPETYRLLPDGVTALETRMPIAGENSFEAVRRMAESAQACGDLLAQSHVDVIGYCCMGTTMLKGWEWEDEILARLSERTGRPATSANRALIEALRHLQARRIACVTPYPKHFNDLLPGHFGARGIQVQAVTGVEVQDVGNVRHVRPETLYTLARRVDGTGADAVCLLATDVETLPVLATLEDDLGIPVVSNNQTLVWSALRTLGIGEAIPGYGSLLARLR